MCICDHMYKFAHLHIAYLREHMKQHSILAYIPVICRQHILGTLVQDSVQCQLVAALFFCHIERHAVCTRIQIHLMKILMYIDIRHDPAAVRIILQIIEYTVYLIHHSFFVDMLYAHLIAVCLPDRSIFICPAVPDVTVQIVDIIGFFLPDPQKLVRTAFDPGSSECQCREFFSQIIPVHHTKFFYSIRRSPVFPSRTYLFSFCAGSIINDVPAHLYKNFVCITHA